MAEELGHAGTDGIAAGAGERAGAVACTPDRRPARLREPVGRADKPSARSYFIVSENFMIALRRAISFAAPLLLTLGFAPAQAADRVADFYHGKTVQVL